MRIDQVCLRELRMRLLTPFETSFDRSFDRRILLVNVVANGVSGWGEATVDSNPFYTYETVETAWHIIRDFVWPMLKGRELASAAEIWDLLAPIRGHNMARGGFEAAVWDAEARQKGQPLWKLLGGKLEEIPCGVSIGIKPSISELLEAVEKELRAGYQRIKIKIKHGKDIEQLAAVRERFPRARLMGDANCDYRLEDIPHLKSFERFHLMMIEQPLAYDDLYSHAELQRQLAVSEGQERRGALHPDALAQLQSSVQDHAIQIERRSLEIKELEDRIQAIQSRTERTGSQGLATEHDEVTTQIGDVRQQILSALRDLAEPLRRYEALAEKKSRLSTEISARTGRNQAYVNYIEGALFRQSEFIDDVRYVVETLRKQRVVA